MTLSVQQLSDRLQLVHDRFANQINSRDLGPDYNFLERQQAGHFIDAIADAFGWTNQQMDAYTHEYRIENLPGIQEGDVDFDDDMNLVPKTHGWIDCAFIPHVIWEMKSPTNANGSARPLSAQNETQLWRYWTALPAPKPRYLILSNFREFRIFESTLGSGAEAVHVFPLARYMNTRIAFHSFPKILMLQSPTLKNKSVLLQLTTL